MDNFRLLEKVYPLMQFIYVAFPLIKLIFSPVEVVVFKYYMNFIGEKL